jgi:hypothetical protein
LNTLVPNMDDGSAGCQNARGIGPIPDPAAPQVQETGVGVMPELHGRSPAEARAAAVAAGHTVVFNVGGTCWCVTPPAGTVTDSWWGQHGALWLWVDGMTPPAEKPPFLGFGC